jgi:hypothetical protein
MELKEYQVELLKEIKAYLSALAKEQAHGNKHAALDAYKREIARHFEKMGKRVSWQKLGEGFDKHEFRFQILDEGLYDSWKDEMNKLLCA